MTSFARPTRTTLVSRAKDDLNGRLPGADSRLRRSFVGGIATMHGGGMDGAYGYLDYIADQIMPDTADDVHLRRWAAFWGVFPKTATAAAGTATGAATGVADIPAGTVLQRGDGVGYVTTADTPVIAGAVTIPVLAETAGAIGGAEAGVFITLVSPIAGVGAQFVVAGDGMTGADPETDPELLGRLLARIQNPPKGGGPGDYVAWALEVAGVTRAWEYPNRMGLGTVQVFFVFDDRPDIFPLVGDVATMQAWLDGLAPVTAVVTALAPEILTVNFQIALTPSTTTVRAAVEAELAAFFEREGSPSATLLKSHYDQAISFAAGETDFTVVSPAGDVVPTPGQLPILGEIAWL